MSFLSTSKKLLLVLGCLVVMVAGFNMINSLSNEMPESDLPAEPSEQQTVEYDQAQVQSAVSEESAAELESTPILGTNSSEEELRAANTPVVSDPAP